MPGPSVHKIILPVLSENTRSATVVKVLVSENEPVREGQPLFEMVTDKAEFDFESTSAGTLQKLFVSVNSEVPAGFVLALVGEGKPSPDLLKDCETHNARVLQEFASVVDVPEIWRDAEAPQDAIPAASRVRAAPAARRLAGENHVLLTDVKQALGIEGLVKEEHVREYLDKRGESRP